MLLSSSLVMKQRLYDISIGSLPHDLAQEKQPYWDLSLSIST